MKIDLNLNYWIELKYKLNNDKKLKNVRPTYNVYKNVFVYLKKLIIYPWGRRFIPSSQFWSLIEYFTYTIYISWIQVHFDQAYDIKGLIIRQCEEGFGNYAILTTFSVTWAPPGADDLSKDSKLKIENVSKMFILLSRSSFSLPSSFFEEVHLIGKFLFEVIFINSQSEIYFTLWAFA